MDFHIRDIDQAIGGRHRIEWAYQEMPVLQSVPSEVGVFKLLTEGSSGVAVEGGMIQ